MKYPLLFGYRDLIAGNGFIAGVATDGRFLLVEDEDPNGEFWVYGVNPGGIAGGGMNRHEALQDFRAGYKSVLYDIATDASTFEEFEAEARRFFDETNRRTEAQWRAAVDAVRSGDVKADWVSHRSFEGAVKIKVELLESPSAAVNVLDQPESVAA